ncbi:MAG: FkbM family methyltransferase [Niveispirillum sp.]|uniref:FkbM family methyltransferase n=1 Tax=Niveispirillum sp. TaxID=1917217 RepID=UPI003BA50ED6
MSLPDGNHDPVTFWNNFRSYIDFMRRELGVLNIEFQPKPGRGLYAQMSASPDTATIRTRCDSAITPVTLANHHWQIEELLFAKKVLDTVPAAVLVDVGANMGLFTRQILGWCGNVKRTFAYEPEPANFACLLHNVACFDNVVPEMVGLAETDGVFRLFLDLQNCGNNSLVSDDLAGAQTKGATEVRVINAAVEARRWLEDGLPIFYKSDTQGYDEKIITLLPDEVWDNVVGGVIEIENIDKPEFEMAKFVAFLDRYENKVILDRPETIVSTSEVLGYLHRGKGPGVDLGFWK